MKEKSLSYHFGKDILFMQQPLIFLKRLLLQLRFVAQRLWNPSLSYTAPTVVLAEFAIPAEASILLYEADIMEGLMVEATAAAVAAVTNTKLRLKCLNEGRRPFGRLLIFLY